jgi:hypothetical protein
MNTGPALIYAMLDHEKSSPEPWSAQQIADELGFSGPNSANSWRLKMETKGLPIPLMSITIERGRRTYWYDSAAALAARESQVLRIVEERS